MVRNVTGCPLAGVAADELIDASGIAQEIAHLLTANTDFYNLPRKFKISATGCPSWCTYPEINDIGLVAAVRDGKGRLRSALVEARTSRILPFAWIHVYCRTRLFRQCAR